MYWRRVAATALTAVVSISLAGSALAQSLEPSVVEQLEPPENAPIQAGPFSLAPVARITNLGHDSNVFNVSEDQNPQGDVILAANTTLDGWLRFTHLRVAGRGRFDFYYYKELTELRAVDTDSGGRLDVPLNWLTPFVSGTFVQTRQSQNLELDALAQRQSDSLTVGTDVRLTSRATATIYAKRSTVDYEEDSFYQGTDLATALNFTGRGEGAALRYRVTSLTTVGVEVQRQRDRFDTSPERDADSFYVTPMVEFNPLAVINGRASIGFQHREFVTGIEPDFDGTVVYAALSYTLLERTRFTVDIQRHLSYLVPRGPHGLPAIGHRAHGGATAGGILGRGRRHRARSPQLQPQRLARHSLEYVPGREGVEPAGRRRLQPGSAPGSVRSSIIGSARATKPPDYVVISGCESGPTRHMRSSARGSVASEPVRKVMSSIAHLRGSTLQQLVLVALLAILSLPSPSAAQASLPTAAPQKPAPAPQRGGGRLRDRPGRRALDQRLRPRGPVDQVPRPGGRNADVSAAGCGESRRAHGAGRREGNHRASRQAVCEEPAARRFGRSVSQPAGELRGSGPSPGDLPVHRLDETL